MADTVRILQPERSRTPGWLSEQLGGRQVLDPEEYRHDVLGGRVGRTTLYDAIRRGQVPTIRIGRRILIPVAALERMFEGVVDDDWE